MFYIYIFNIYIFNIYILNIFIFNIYIFNIYIFDISCMLCNDTNNIHCKADLPHFLFSFVLFSSLLSSSVVFSSLLTSSLLLSPLVFSCLLLPPCTDILALLNQRSFYLLFWSTFQVVPYRTCWPNLVFSQNP